MKLSYIYSSRTGLRRTANEDYVDVFEVDDGLLAVLCDGLGGNNAGEVASKLAVTTIYNYFIEHPEEEYLPKINFAINEANSALIKAAMQNPDYKGMATTAVVLFINQSVAYWGHVGDSRLYYKDEKGIVQISKDHSFVQKLLDDGYITEKEAENHPHKNVIMRALGDKTSILVDHESFSFDKNRRWKFLLCSDGVSNVLSKSDLDKMLQPDDLDSISKSFSQLIEDRGAPDNYSYVIISNQVH
jgi:protein phosphatase